MKGIFIVGVDTDAGKTMVGTALGVWLKKEGLPVRVIKPFETGCIPFSGQLRPLDGSLYKLLLGLAEPIEEIVPFRFSEPLAPYQTSLIDGRPIRYQEDSRYIRQRISEGYFYLLEGAGGLFVPLEKDIFLIDLIADLGLPTLVVAPNRLGTINHTLLTLEALAGRRIENIGVILSEKERTGSLVKGLNKEYFQDYLGEKYWGEFPFIPSLAKLVRSWPALLKEGSMPPEKTVADLRNKLQQAFERRIAVDRLRSKIAPAAR